MAKRYRADFYGGLPKEGQAPALTLHVEASSNMSALDKATKEMFRRHLNYSHVMVREDKPCVTPSETS